MNHVTFWKKWSDRFIRVVFPFTKPTFETQCTLDIRFYRVGFLLVQFPLMFWPGKHYQFQLDKHHLAMGLSRWFPRAPKVASFSRGFWVEVLVEFLDDFQLFACVRRHHPHTRLGGLGRWGGRSQTVSQNMKENKFEKNCMNEMAKPART